MTDNKTEIFVTKYFDGTLSAVLINLHTGEEKIIAERSHFFMEERFFRLVDKLAATSGNRINYQKEVTHIEQARREDITKIKE